MTDSTHTTLLRRMIRAHDDQVVENPITSSRAVRLALIKAANDAVGLVLTVDDVATDTAALDEMLAPLSDELMLVGLTRADKLAGFIGFDMELRGAVAEMQTMGVLAKQEAETRPPTRTDKSLCDLLVAPFLAAFPAAVAGTDLEGWIDGAQHSNMINSTRVAGLVLEDRMYRIMRMTVDFGVADRKGVLLLALPTIDLPQEVLIAPNDPAEWAAAFQKNVNRAPAKLNAILNTCVVSLAAAQKLHVGSILPLPGCTVDGVRLIAPDRRCVAQAKLGQIGGMRAVRIQGTPLPEMAELGHHSLRMPSIQHERIETAPVFDMQSEDATAPGAPHDAAAMLDPHAPITPTEE